MFSLQNHQIINATRPKTSKKVKTNPKTTNRHKQITVQKSNKSPKSKVQKSKSPKVQKSKSPKAQSQKVQRPKYKVKTKRKSKKQVQKTSPKNTSTTSYQSHHENKCPNTTTCKTGPGEKKRAHWKHSHDKNTPSPSPHVSKHTRTQNNLSSFE